MASAVFALGVLALSMTVPVQVNAQAAVDPAATQILKRMTDYLDSLKQFSVHTQNTIEDMLDSGQRIDSDVSANVTVSRPNKLRAERQGELLDQAFYYDGKTLTLYNPSDRVYGTEPAPATIEEMLHYASDSLGLIIPAADLVYHDAYPLLMQGVTSAVVVGKAVINGVTCDHLAFSRPDVDFQVWDSEGRVIAPFRACNAFGSSISLDGYETRVIRRQWTPRDDYYSTTDRILPGRYWITAGFVWGVRYQAVTDAVMIEIVSPGKDE